MALAETTPLHSGHQPDRLRSLGIMALNGMFDELDGLSVLRQAATELLPGNLAIVSLLCVAALGCAGYVSSHDTYHRNRLR